MAPAMQSRVVRVGYGLLASVWSPAFLGGSEPGEQLYCKGEAAVGGWVLASQYLGF